MKKNLFSFLFLSAAISVSAADFPLISNVYGRDYISLNGKWNYVIDPLENGYYDYRLQPLKNGFFANEKPATPSDLVEYDLDKAPIMDIPGDWNTRDNRLFFYEGTVWFKRDFTVKKTAGKRYVIYFGSVNYDAKVYVNGKKVGEHIGGYTPFNFDVTEVLKDGANFVVVKADNKRHKDNVPTVNMDWWNYGGITRDVLLVALPDTCIADYLVQLHKGRYDAVSGFVQISRGGFEPSPNQSVTLEIPELKILKQFTTDENGKVSFEIKAKPVLWSPENPKLYDVIISSNNEKITDKIGFRNIETVGKEIRLNGKKVFLRGISIHEEAPFRQGRAATREDARTLLNWAKELGCNYVRLAHYPHNEFMVRAAEEMGFMVWSEIPVYWTISWENEATYQNAERQLNDMIFRDKNRCAIVIWSIANETPHSDARDKFLGNLAKFARSKDNSRLISMAMEVTSAKNNINELNDNMNEYVDVASFNQYVGWYRGTNDDARKFTWHIPYDKPVIISEFGGGALYGLHGSKTERWTEEYQEELYIRNLEMIDKIDGLSGLSPWILVDFYSPRRALTGIQDYFNRKGLVSSSGNKKKAFFIMQEYYKNKK